VGSLTLLGVTFAGHWGGVVHVLPVFVLVFVFILVLVTTLVLVIGVMATLVMPISGPLQRSDAALRGSLACISWLVKQVDLTFGASGLVSRDTVLPRIVPLGSSQFAAASLEGEQRSANELRKKAKSIANTHRGGSLFYQRLV
jgi:hypothetical protein